MHSDTEHRLIEFPVSHLMLNLDQSVAFRATTLWLASAEFSPNEHIGVRGTTRCSPGDVTGSTGRNSCSLRPRQRVTVTVSIISLNNDVIKILPL